MAEEIDVSFVMTVYNKEFYLPSVITALLGQTGLKNPEFIFVDDVSNDNSVEIIRRDWRPDLYPQGGGSPPNNPEYASHLPFFRRNYTKLQGRLH